jgi:hypothetical protein
MQLIFTPGLHRINFDSYRLNFTVLKVVPWFEPLLPWLSDVSTVLLSLPAALPVKVAATTPPLLTLTCVPAVTAADLFPTAALILLLSCPLGPATVCITAAALLLGAVLVLTPLPLKVLSPAKAAEDIPKAPAEAKAKPRASFLNCIVIFLFEIYDG